MASSPPPVFSFSASFGDDDDTNKHENHATSNSDDGPVYRFSSAPVSASFQDQPSSPPSHPEYQQPTFTLDEHGDIDLPWITRDLNRSASSQNLYLAPTSPSVHSLTHRASDLNLSAHPSRHAHSRKNQSKTACFVHSLLQNGRARSPSRGGSSDELARGAFVDNMTRGPERRDRWNRGMTKKELSDMALGVRELSKRLGGARMKLRVKTIIIITKKNDHALIGLTRQVTDWLLYHHRSRRDKYVDQDYQTDKCFDFRGLLKSNPVNDDYVKFWTPELCSRKPHLFDFVITLGGDGTVLYTSWLFQRVVPPVASFSLGSLGFLTPFDFSDFQNTLHDSFDRGVTARLRMRFECTIMRAVENGDVESSDESDRSDVLEMHPQSKETENQLVDGTVGDDSLNHHTEEYWKSNHQQRTKADWVKEEEGLNRGHRAMESFAVLNELVVDRGPNPFLSTLELYGDEEHLTSVIADGLVIATPTGSTAYSLSAGGSLVHPEIPAMLISPICPHTLSFRPLLVPDSMVLRVVVPTDSRSTAWCSFDGRNRLELKQGDYVAISASRFPFPTVLKQKEAGDWFDSISRTLNWNERKRQKKFDDPVDEKAISPP